VSPWGSCRTNLWSSPYIGEDTWWNHHECNFIDVLPPIRIFIAKNSLPLNQWRKIESFLYCTLFHRTLSVSDFLILKLFSKSFNLGLGKHVTFPRMFHSVYICKCVRTKLSLKSIHRKLYITTKAFSLLQKLKFLHSSLRRLPPRQLFYTVEHQDFQSVYVAFIQFLHLSIIFSLRPIFIFFYFAISYNESIFCF